MNQLGPGVPINVSRLVESRMLIQANSGGGKSYAIRKLCESTYGDVQQIIVDVEGEFSSLREKYDYILAGPGGDCQADLRSAALLARRLLELNVSAIIDISELGVNRARFVRLFFEAMINAPKALWHPVLVILDEAHLFAPEKTRAESLPAVVDLMTRGRKRGFAGVLATQRISKLSKDASAECNNKLIGRCVEGLDRKRAAEELGFTSGDDIRGLRTLQPGEFYAFGPAMTDDTIKTKIGAVKTSHPRAGERAATPPPPRERVKKILAQLADLPQEAEAELKTTGELRTRVRELERQLAAAPKTQVETKVVETKVLKESEITRVEKVIERMTSVTNAAIARSNDLLAALRGAQQTSATLARVRVGTHSSPGLRATPARIETSPVTDEDVAKIRAVLRKPPRKVGFNEAMAERNVAKGDTTLGKCPREVLRALRSRYPTPLTRIQTATLAGYSHKTGGYANALSELRSRGYINKEMGSDIQLTDEGLAAAPVPEDGDLLNLWVKRLKPRVGSLLTILVEHGGHTRDELAAAVGLSPSTGGYANMLSKLNSNGLIEKHDGKIFAADTFTGGV